MEKIELIGVNKSFKEEKVLKDICLTLTDDKIYGLLEGMVLENRSYLRLFVGT